MYCVYRHIFPNNKSYIGITRMTPEKRWGIEGYNYRTQVVYRAIVKYGWDNIEHIIVKDNLSESEACKLEKELIEKYNTANPSFGYNCTTGGESGYVCSEATRKKLRESHLGQRPTQKTIDAMRKAHTGVHKGVETKEKIRCKRIKYLSENPPIGERNPFYGKHHSTETKHILSEQRLGVPGKANKECTARNSETGEEMSFRTQHDVAKFLCVSEALISKAIKNNAQVKGYEIGRN